MRSVVSIACWPSSAVEALLRLGQERVLLALLPGELLRGGGGTGLQVIQDTGLLFQFSTCGLQLLGLVIDRDGPLFQLLLAGFLGSFESMETNQVGAMLRLLLVESLALLGDRRLGRLGLTEPFGELALEILLTAIEQATSLLQGLALGQQGMREVVSTLRTASACAAAASWSISTCWRCFRSRTLRAARRMASCSRARRVRSRVAALLELIGRSATLLFPLGQLRLQER